MCDDFKVNDLFIIIFFFGEILELIFQVRMFFVKGIFFIFIMNLKNNVFVQLILYNFYVISKFVILSDKMEIVVFILFFFVGEVLFCVYVDYKEVEENNMKQQGVLV